MPDTLESLKALVIDYQMFYGLKTLKEAMKYIRKDLRYLLEQEGDYNIISIGNSDGESEYLSVQA